VSGSGDLVADLLAAWAEAVAPLADALDSPAGLAALIGELGWNLAPDADNSITAIFTGVSTAITDLKNAATELGAVAKGDDNALLRAIADLTKGVTAVTGEIRALTGNKGNPAWPAPLNDPAFWSSFPIEVLDYLIYHFLKETYPKLFGLLYFIGALGLDLVDAPPVGREPYERPTVNWALIPAVVADPKSLFTRVYGWDGTFDHQKLSRAVEQLLGSFGVPGDAAEPYDRTLLDPYYDPGSTVPAGLLQINAPILFSVQDTGPAMTTEILSIVLLPIPAAGDKLGQPVGFAIFPLAQLTAGGTIALSDIASLTVSGGFESAPIRAEIRPSGVTIATDLAATKLSSRAQVDIKPPTPLILIGSASGTRVELSAAHFRLGADVSASRSEFEIAVGLAGLGLVIDFSKADGFLQKILGSQPQQLDFSSEIRYSSRTGFGFSGQAELEAAVAVHLDILGVLQVDTIYIALRASANPSAVDLVIAASARLSIGPIAASVDRIGLEMKLTPAAPGQPPGNLGNLDLGFGFKPPSGLGINLDAGPITGGGFIEFDPDNGRYAGVLALSLYSIQVKAIGLLDTKMPGGESGYSFLVIISVEFTPIQLGFGITLNGVGGLCGINRNFVTDALRAGLRQHSLDHILFPKDPVKNAPAIISDLRAIFPPAEGRYVFGPMLELGWGGGLNLVTVELGVILGLPSPVVIAILGQLNVNLPSPDAAIVELHLDVLGIIDFGKKLFSLDATLYDSRIVVFTIYGDMAMRLSWGDHPSFALAVGGVNPHFQPPAGFPTLKRLTIALSATENFRLTIQTYFAITSNSFQLGAHAELYIGVSDFNVYGWLGFDALLIFEPFSFVVDFTAGLAFRSGNSTLMGISISGELSGPTPWHAKGEAHISLLFFDIGVHVDTTWGESRQIDAPHTDAWPQLHDAIANLGNWSGALPPGVPAVVTLAKPAADTKSILLADPSGTLTMRERVCPLDQTLTKFGEAVPGPQNVFSLDAVSLGGQSAPFTKIRDKFAPAQFEQMKDQDKLSRPSFEDRDAGFSVGDGLVTVGHGFGLDLAFEDVYVDDKAPPPPSAPVFYRPSLNLQALWAASNGAAKSALHRVAMGSYAPPVTAAPLIIMSDEHFVVATTTDLTQRADITAPTTKGEAYQALAAHLSSNPAERDQLQVVPFHELAP
jgi:hypothetical protein